MSRIATSLTVALMLASLASAGDAPGKSAPAFQPGAKPGEFTFDTGVLSGTLRPGGRSMGLGQLRIDGQQIAGSLGILSHYRLLTPKVRYGSAAWDIPSTATLADGAVEARWPAAKDRPFEIHARYQWAAADALDVVSTVKAQANLPKFELFLASYFSGFERAFAYAQEEGKAGFVEAVKEKGVWQMFPRDEQGVQLIQDGRWKLPPHPVDWKIMPRLAGAMAMRRDAKTGLTALVMARPGDCFAVAMPFGAEGHRSLYLCLLGRDIPAGQSTTTHARLVVGKDISDQQAVQRYEQFMKDAVK